MFDDFEKICYNIYRKLRKEKKLCLMILTFMKLAKNIMI